MSKLQTAPSGWKLTTLGTFMEFKNGVNADKNAYGSGTEFVNVMDIFKRNFMKKCNILGKVEITEKQKKEYSVKYGDILFNRTSEVPDEIAFSSVYLDEDEITFGGFVIRGRQKKELLVPLFAGYCFNSSSIRREMIRRSQGVVRANIGQKDLNKVPILIPPKDIQEKIASVLALWDNAIEKAEALIAVKEKQFEWLTQSLISKKCPDWTHYLARELFTGISSKGYPNEELLSVTQDQGVIPRSMLSGRVMSPAGSTAGYKLVEKGNFVISLRSFQGGLEYSDYRGIVSPAYTVLSSKKQIHSGFYRHFFKSYIFIEKYLSVAVIGIRDGKQISATDFDTVKIPYPDMDEQTKIASQLDTARQEINLLKNLLKKYRSQKRGLMQKLLTGEWQVGRSESVAEGIRQELIKGVSA